METIKQVSTLMGATLVLFLSGAAQAVPITHTIDFDGTNGSDNGAFESGPFTLDSFSFVNTPANCPSNGDPLVEEPCTALNTEASFVIYLTAGGVFDLVDFWWISTGGQENSNLVLESPNNPSQQFSFTPDNSTTAYESNLGISGVTSVTFRNVSTSVHRIDNISLLYDDGTEPPCVGDDCPCTGPNCGPVDVPEPGTLGLLGLGLLGLGLRRRSKI